MNPAKMNKYDPAPDAHIQPREQIDPEIFALLMRLCPAGLYWEDENGQHYDYLNCLECGVCRIVAGEENFKKWNFPDGGHGVDYSG